MPKKKTSAPVATSASPTRQAQLFELLGEYKRLSLGEYEGPVACIPLEVRDMIFKNPQVEALIAEENVKRQEEMKRVEEAMKDLDLDEFNLACQKVLESLVSKKSISPKFNKAMKKAQSAVDDAMEILVEENPRRMQREAEIRDVVQKLYNSWLKSGLPLEEHLTVGRPLRLKLSLKP
ncbi:MAG: hypothetical protein ACAH83_16335 [Alphaproteobacteria bacterium]